MTTPLRMGLLGCAGVTEYAVMDILSDVPELAITAVASRDKRKAEAFASHHGIGTVHSYDSLLTDPQLDAIYIPLPNSMHCDWSIRALEAGKAVLCEKPLAANADEAQRMAAAAQKTGGILVEAFHWRYHPLSERMAEIAKTLGDIRRVEARFVLPRSIVADDNIRWRYELGGGATMDTGCYCVNLLRLLLGEPERVLSALPTLAAAQVDGRMKAALLFRNGAIGTIEASQIEEDDAIVAVAEIVGSRGWLRITQPFMPQWGNRMEWEIDGESFSETASTTATYTYQARAFVDIVKNGAAIRTSVHDGLANMRVIDSIYRAAGMRPRGTLASETA